MAGGPPDGPSGGKLQSRNSVAADPTPSIIVSATGSMYSPQSGHKIGLEGSSYRYGPTVVGGIFNMVMRDGYAVSIQRSASTANLQVNQILGNNAVAGDALPFLTPMNQSVGGLGTGIGNGLVSQGVLGGCPPEVFTSAGTITVTNGSANVVGVGTAFTTTTVPGYAYTPSLQYPALGDYLKVGGKYYVIYEINDATHLKIYPVYEGATAGGQAYTIERHGFFSRSRIVTLPDETSAATPGAAYYRIFCAGDTTQLAQPLDLFAHESIHVGTIGVSWGTTATPLRNYTCPKTDPAALPIAAADIAYYKGFLLYAGNTTVGWSVNPFPSAFPFGATDFPDNNITVIDPSDVFVGFEYLGDQLVAIFENSIWLVVPTGSVPEFNFYRLPENRGCLPSAVILAGDYSVHGRPHVSASGAIYYMSAGGVIEFTGSIGKIISNQVMDRLNFPNGTLTLWWDKVLDAINVDHNGD